MLRVRREFEDVTTEGGIAPLLSSRPLKGGFGQRADDALGRDHEDVAGGFVMGECPAPNSIGAGMSRLDGGRRRWAHLAITPINIGSMIV